MKILLVDDDVQFIRCLQGSVEWNRFGITDVFAAYSKNEAMEIIREHSPQIVITDIEMPMGSGIELVEWIRRMNFACEIIVLTNYERFEIARSAIHFGVVRYLTKPVSDAELEDAVVEAMERHENAVSFTWMGKRQVRRNLFSQESMLLDALYSSGPCLLKVPFLLFCLCLYDPKEEYRAYERDFDLRREAAACFEDLTPTEMAETRQDRQILFWFSLPVHHACRDHPDRLREDLRNLGMKLGCRAACYETSVYRPESLHGIAEKIESLALDNLSDEPLTELHDEGEEEREQPELKLSRPCYRLYTEDDRRGIVILFNDRIQQLQEEKQLDKSVLSCLRDEFLQATDAFLFDAGFQFRNVWKNETEKQLLSDSVNSVFDLLRMIDFVSQRTVELMKGEQESESVIIKAIGYIRDRYAFPLSRTDVAEYVGFSPDHFSRLFKARTGMSFNEYLTDYRIRKAKGLLRNTQSSISEIAVAVGYDNIPYFSRIFKRCEQMTPEQYRKSAKND